MVVERIAALRGRIRHARGAGEPHAGAGGALGAAVRESEDLLLGLGGDPYELWAPEAPRDAPRAADYAELLLLRAEGRLQHLGWETLTDAIAVLARRRAGGLDEPGRAAALEWAEDLLEMGLDPGAEAALAASPTPLAADLTMGALGPLMEAEALRWALAPPAEGAVGLLEPRHARLLRGVYDAGWARPPAAPPLGPAALCPPEDPSEPAEPPAGAGGTCVAA